MDMKKAIKINQLIYLACFLFLGGTACNTLDQEPVNSIETEGAITNFNDAQLVLKGMYDELQSGNYYGLRYLYYQDVYADNLLHSGTFTTDQEVSARRINPSNLQMASTWGTLYKIIGTANFMLEVLPEIGNISTSQAAAIEGEARFVRALVYFDLLKIFGGVPIVTDFVSNISEISLAGRATETEVYDFIIEDLDFAENNLGNTPNAPFRANAWAAKALLARVHLQVGNYVLAIQKATEVINAGFILLPNYGDVSRIKGNNEMIFELNFTNNVGDQNALAISSDPSTSGQKFYLRPGFYNAFVASANRGDERFATSVLQQGNNLRIIKYFRTNTSDDNVPILRLAEMYLIRAEANARQIGAGLTTGAIIDDINIIRQRANLAPLLLTDIPTIAGALEEILEQRRFEFAFEGHRYTDLRRYGIADDLFPLGESYRELWPIPLQELELNENLTQNDGYSSEE